jgi:hypothetical protein
MKLQESPRVKRGSEELLVSNISVDYRFSNEKKTLKNYENTSEIWKTNKEQQTKWRAKKIHFNQKPTLQQEKNFRMTTNLFQKYKKSL